MYLCTSVFFFFFKFVVCKLCRFFPFFEKVFSNSHYSNEFSQFLGKKIVATVRKFTKKNHCSVQGFSHSGFICYDGPCNFSFSPQATPIIATGQGEPAPKPAPKLVHSPS